MDGGQHMNKYYTFTEEDILEKGNDYVLSKIEPNLISEIETILEATKSDLIYSMSGCESPIEQSLALALQIQTCNPYIVSKCATLGIEIMEIQAQSEISPNKKKYRLDFMITVSKAKTLHYFVIECDGHDFHEKTKEQAQKDKERERAITKCGCTVIRFTGSEIYKNNYKCAREVFDIIFSNFERR